MSLQLHNSVFEKKLSEAALHSLLKRSRTAFTVPAVSVVIFNDEKILRQETQGVRNINTNDWATADDYFHIGSTAKSLLGVIAAKMIEQDLLRWDTKFFDLYPELKNESNEDYFNITLEHLFLAKAGIKAFTTREDAYPKLLDSGNNRFEFVTWLLKQPSISKKTTDGKFKYTYSNAGYTIIASMLEKVSNKSWEELIHQTLFVDLGLDYKFGWPNAQDDSQPCGHGIFDYNPITDIGRNVKKLQPFLSDNPYALNNLIAPAGDISMKPLDFAKYSQLHLKGLVGKDNYLSSSMFQFLNFGYKDIAIGIYNFLRSGKRISGFDGSAGTFYCRSLILPDDNLGMTIFINSGSRKAVDWISAKIAKRYYNWWWKFWM